MALILLMAGPVEPERSSHVIFSGPSQTYEILSIKVTATSCTISDGNVVGTES